jgi:hypothetical protein
MLAILKVVWPINNVPYSFLRSGKATIYRAAARDADLEARKMAVSFLRLQMPHDRKLEALVGQLDMTGAVQEFERRARLFSAHEPTLTAELESGPDQLQSTLVEKWSTV